MRGAVSGGPTLRRAQIAAGVRGPRADASESTRCAVRAAPCLSLHVIHSPAGSISAWRRRAMQPGGVSANDTRSGGPPEVACDSLLVQPQPVHGLSPDEVLLHDLLDV